MSIAAIGNFGRMSPRRDRLLKFIHRELEMKGVAPTHIEMRKYMGTTSRGTVTTHLQKLEVGGYIERPGMPPRNITVTQKGIEYVSEQAALATKRREARKSAGK